MLKRWAAWPLATRWLAGIAAVVLAAVIVWALFVPLADLLARHDVGPAKPALLQTARDAARGRLLTLVAGLFAAGALVFTALNFTLSRRTFELTEQGQVTDRFTKAIEQLGSDKLDVRIGGIYALERVARDSAKDHPTVMEVLTAFIREHAQEPWPVGDGLVQHGEKKTRPDVQAAVTVVGRRDAERDIRVIDLTAADLTGAVLTDADLSDAVLTRADLTGAVLFHAVLNDANLTAAILTNADLASANLAGADLAGADPIDADLVGANLSRADLTDTDLTRADLTRAHLASAHLAGARLASARLASADLAGADLTGARLASADLTGADLTVARLADAEWPEGVQAPDGWMVDSDSGRLITTSYQR
jgi:uncharacterized protein YjbI with pentapeptide repeats